MSLDKYPSVKKRIIDKQQQEIRRKRIHKKERGNVRKILVVLCGIFALALASNVNRVMAQEQEKVWGSFPEASIWAGAWMNPDYETSGVWANLKYLQWYTKFEKAENFAIGATVRGDYGATAKAPIDWGYLALGPRVGYYRGLGLRNSIEIDAGLLYRFDENREGGPMGSIHAEFDHLASYKNRVIFQVDADLFPGDSWVGPGIHLDHKVNKDVRVVPGAVLSMGFLDGETIMGFMPTLKAKYRNRFTVGVNANLFTGQGTFLGVVAAYEFTPDIFTWMEDKKKRQ